MSIFDFFRKKKQQPELPPNNQNGNMQKETIKRYVEILTESIQLVNDSNNLDTVLKRYLIVYNTLNKLLPYSDTELKEAGYALKGSITNTQSYMQNNRAAIINQAIERNITYEIGLLKTPKGKINKLDTLYQNIKNNNNLETSNLVFLENLYLNIIYLVINYCS